VRVFFRLFQTAATGTSYDSKTYARGGLSGVKIAMPGVQGGELVTIPFFAEPRVNAGGPVDLNGQKDKNNVQDLTPDGSGQEQQAYFACWLDFNQTSPTLFPLQPSPPQGPYTSGTLLTIQQIIRGLHQCLVAEIAYDQDPISPGVSPGSSDKLAQRNLAIVESDNPGSLASHRIPHTFTFERTRANLGSGERPDELMIDWGDTPPGSTATLYLPGMQVAEILGLAGRLFDLQTLERVDDHTLRCKTGGVTYVPIPPSVGASLAGLLTIDLPPTVRKGQVFKVVVHQVTTSKAAQRRQPPPPRITADETPGPRAIIREGTARRILGAFQLTIPVTTREVMLAPEERALSVLRYIEESIPPENRWSLPFRRYVTQIADRVGALGGDPGAIGPSPSGDGNPPCGDGDGDHDHHHHHHRHDHDHDRHGRRHDDDDR
jgi:hypothetical protein